MPNDVWFGPNVDEPRSSCCTYTHTSVCITNSIDGFLIPSPMLYLASARLFPSPLPWRGARGEDYAGMGYTPLSLLRVYLYSVWRVSNPLARQTPPIVIVRPSLSSVRPSLKIVCENLEIQTHQKTKEAIHQIAPNIMNAVYCVPSACHAQHDYDAALAA
jgi:hypothetical protein